MLTYEHLSEPERRLWDACPTGSVVDLRSGEAIADDPADGAAWGDGRTVRAEAITAAPPTGAVDLQDAQAVVLHDNEHSRPADTRLDGFTYTSIQAPAAGPGPVADRLARLARLQGYSPQAYEQLASWYRRIGHEDDVRRVLLAPRGTGRDPSSGSATP
ncbi:hypothetical protein PUR61_17735 [Streptomyces sp. BE20]|uniref:hypothetical protein n=1 Tax=Streptomyces sp. BE20 TaxID=3002525 RepID=UPI002E782559|nr:hypothetical protein [Streptomyces sp. BE20]MEE1824016.1 hypothetical protein [Streptomyces sp. BE20]